jgi:hypothetical protein
MLKIINRERITLIAMLDTVIEYCNNIARTVRKKWLSVCDIHMDPESVEKWKKAVEQVSLKNAATLIFTKFYSFKTDHVVNYVYLGLFSQKEPMVS